MFKGLKDQVNKVRYGDLAIRKKWFLVSVIIIFVLVVAIWAVLFGSIFSGSQTETQVQSGGFLEFWQTFKNGVSLLGDKIVEVINTVKSFFAK